MSGIVTKSFNEYMDEEPTLTDFTNDGKCSNCGGCCTNLLPMTANEILKIKRYIKKFGIKPSIRPVFALSNVVVDLTCPFRDEGRRICTIYDVKPKICADFICNHDETDIEKIAHEMKDTRYKYKLVSVRDEFFNQI